jgi:hypothetical protein
MLRFLTIGALIMGAGFRSEAFSLIGPLLTYQTQDIYYDPDPTIYGDDIGGPQNLGEEYRWNVPTIFYAFDYTFLDYFGQRGVEAVEDAIATFNALPEFTSMSADLSEYPLATLRINYRASALALADLKSAAMMAVLEELGLAHAERFVWTIRQRELLPGAQCPVFDHWVIKRNFDPETWLPTSYVNGVLYTYLIVISCPPAQDFSHALEFPMDPTAITHTSLSSLYFGYQLGGFYSGLTRDDVGGLRYLYRSSNYNVEDLPAGSQIGLGGIPAGGGGSSGAWTPIGVPSTNQVTDPTDPTVPGGQGTVAVRPGINKLQFVRVDYDSTVGAAFPAFTNAYSSTIVTNGRSFNQTVRRPVLAPDFVFSASDQLDGSHTRTQPVWVQAPAPAGGQDLDGPGVIPPGVNIAFNKIGPVLRNVFPLLGEDTGARSYTWGSFDGSTNAPIIYPSHLSIQELEARVLSR